MALTAETFPYFEVVVAFSVVHYVFMTYVDLR